MTVIYVDAKGKLCWERFDFGSEVHELINVIWPDGCERPKPIIISYEKKHPIKWEPTSERRVTLS